MRAICLGSRTFRGSSDARLQTYLRSRTYVSEPDLVLAGISLRTLQDSQSELIQHVLKRVTQWHILKLRSHPHLVVKSIILTIKSHVRVA
jgi:hypothetical protein